MRSRWKKNLLWTWLVLALVCSMAPVITPPGYAQTAVLTVPTIVHPFDYPPGSTLSVNITVNYVEAMWGYEFKLFYNTTVLNATGASSKFPFNLEWKNYINNTAGYVWIAYSMELGEPDGFFWDDEFDPYEIATIDFNITASGWSTLDLPVSKISNPIGRSIQHDVVHGFFANEIHLIRLTDVTPYPTDVTKQEPVSINVTVENQSPFPYATETFDVSARYNSTLDDTMIIETKTVTLAPLETKTLTFTWDTTYVFAADYTISANATELPSELPAQRADNTLFDGTVTVNPLPVTASFTYTPTDPYENQNITFDASDSTSLTGDIIRYAWDFNDSTTEIYEGANLTDIATHNYTAAGTYYVILNVTDSNSVWDALMKPVTVYRRDVAITSVDPDKTEADVGTPVLIDVTVVNQGGLPETFDVTTYNETTAIETKPVTSLDPGASKTLNFTWETTGLSPGDYTIWSEIIPLPWETDTDDNILTYGTVTLLLSVHDVAITNVTASPTMVSPGEIVSVNVTLANQGGFNETVGSVVTYAGTTVIGTKENVFIESLTPKTLTYSWNTTGVTPGKYKIRATASAVPMESNSANNNKEDGIVTVTGHNIAVTEVKVSPTKATPGENITIQVTVYNTGTENETFDVSIYYDTSLIGTLNVPNLENGTWVRLTFTWGTTGVPEGIYTIKAEADTVPGETETADNEKEAEDKVLLGHHDIAVVDVTVSKTEAVVGESVNISVTVENQGNFTESFNVTVKYDDTDIGTANVTELGAGASKTLTFVWNTTGVAGTYTIKAVASTVTKETETDDNTLTGDTVTVKFTSSITISANPSTLTVGETTAISGSITPKRAGVTVTISYRLTGEDTWNDLTTQTDENGEYSYDWKPTAAGEYEVKAIWAGDSTTYGDESDLETITVEETSDFTPYIVAGVVGAGIALAIVVYMLKVRKPKPK